MPSSSPPSPPRRPHILVAMAYWSEPLYAGIARRAAAYDWVLDDALRWHDSNDFSGTWDGAIVFAWKNRALIERLREARIPLVDLEDYVDHFGASKVVGDDPAVGRVAAGHLLRAGCRSLVFTGEHDGNPVARRRLDGFLDAATAAGLPVGEADDPAETVDRVRAATAPVGVFCNGDKLAVQVERALLDAGLRVPEDAAVLGAHDTQHLCELAPVPLSSVNMDFEGKGEAAAGLLHALLRGDAAPRRIAVPPRGVTTRASTRLAPASTDDVFARLMATLERRCCEAEDVESLCRAAGVPLARARRLVRERLGRTLLEELTRLRVQRAKTLLAEGKMNLPGIAAACGFGTRQTLYLAFRKCEGRAPEDFRKGAPGA